MLNIGVISDTHGLLRPQAIAALKDCQYILHAGDIGAPGILEQLGRIAPVYAIRGNVDVEPWAQSIPLTEVVELGGKSIYILHDRNTLDLNPTVAGFAAVIFGHTHQPLIETKDDVLYFNPGSAGPRRFKLPVSLGETRIHQGKLSPALIPLVA